MIIFIIILFFIILIEVLLIGFIFSQMYLKVENLNINSTNKGITDVYVDKMRINIQIYFFKYIRIFNIKLYKNYFEIFNIKIKYEKILKSYHIENKTDIYRKIYQFYRIIKENYSNINIKKINPKINLLKMHLFLSTENAAFTSFCTCILAAFFSVLLKKNLLNRKYHLNKYRYQITPIYLNINNFKLELETNISASMFNILELVYQYNKVAKEIKNKEKISVKEIFKRTIEGVKILEKVRYINKKVHAINDKF